MPPDGGELGRLLAPVGPRRFLAHYWGRRPLYIPGTADKFAERGFDLPALLKAFVDRNNRLTPGPLRPEEYRLTDGITLQAFRICDRLERLASFCAGVKLALSLPGAVTMT